MAPGTGPLENARLGATYIIWFVPLAQADIFVLARYILAMDAVNV